MQNNFAVRYMKVKAVKPAGVEPVYNMTVEEFHNYLIHGGIILKNCDAIRYYAVTRTLNAEKPVVQTDEDEFTTSVSYDDEMTGGDMDDTYLTYGGG